MFCPFCHDAETKVIDSRLVEESNQVRRRRECLSCSERFTTYEVAELAMPAVVKSDGCRSDFDEDKIRRGLAKALEKRPVSKEKIEEMLANISAQVRACGEREVQARYIGQLVMEALQAVDQVAYVRFASVYRDFQDVDAFKQEIDKLLAR